MDNFNLKKYLSENKLEEGFNPTLDDRPGKFVSSSGRDLQKAKADFSNAILALDTSDWKTAIKTREMYKELGEKLRAHLNLFFDDRRYIGPDRGTPPGLEDDPYYANRNRKTET